MGRKRCLSVDFQDAVDVAARNLTKDEAFEELAGKSYFAYPAPDWIDRIRTIVLYPYWYIRHIMYQRRTKRAAARGRAE